MQRLWVNINGDIEEICVPAEIDEVMPGVSWGRPDELFTPSFWKYQAEAQVRRDRYSHHRLGSNLLEEIAVCLLGGYGIPAEIGMAAFERLKREGMLLGDTSEREIHAQLSQPFAMRGNQRRYRFAAQKASYLARSLDMAKYIQAIDPPRVLRDRLLELPGIGPKTASWIVRNHLNSDDVAIIDVHLHRACVMMNVFEAKSDPAKEYFSLEALFLRFAEAIKVRASVLDAIMWDFMRRIGPTARNGTPQAHQLQLAF
ncbi:8-oxoguanine DNA glycosylase [Ensifer sp. 22521]|uniref:8-oxoguanine DNA glycosylase n=1 Tax=Ensifer sp. 22521 TaxID=3453935 RepID=UPI003F83DFA0